MTIYYKEARPMAYYDSHQWDERPFINGPIKLFRPAESGTAKLPPDAEIPVKFFGEYPNIEYAIQSINCSGRWHFESRNQRWSSGYLDALPDGVELTICESGDGWTDDFSEDPLEQWFLQLLRSVDDE
jgi:hypothetical protein